MSSFTPAHSAVSCSNDSLIVPDCRDLEMDAQFSHLEKCNPFTFWGKPPKSLGAFIYLTVGEV
jgi:hypothetical protein